jgi:hypothetical protein
MLYMIVETFRDSSAVYPRFRERGRLAPDGLKYVSSWVTADVTSPRSKRPSVSRRDSNAPVRAPPLWVLSGSAVAHAALGPTTVLGLAMSPWTKVHYAGRISPTRLRS